MVYIAISSIQVLFFTMSNINKHFILIDILLVSSIHTFITVNKTDLGFYFYNSANSSNGIKVDITNVTDVKRVGFDPDKDTFFYFHGYKDIYTSEKHGQKVKNAVLKNNDVNVLMFDWSVPAKIPYPFLLLTIRPTANYGGEMIQQFATNGALNLSRTTLCGHSFGAIVAGHIGYLLNGRASQAIGLDPTSGLISVQLTFKGMTRASAKYVQIIHTDWFTGDFRALGTADYYVNGGMKQPRCGIGFGKGCSHLLAIDYFVESLLYNDFTATRCGSYWLYEMGLCANNNVSCMGGYYLDTKARGTYYVDTNLDEPYGKGKCINQSTTTKIRS